MKMRQGFPGTFTMTSFVFMALVFGFFSPGLAMKSQNSMEDEIWKLEEAYFSHLYRADYEGVLALVHQQFLGWPDNLSNPIDRNESARFMKRLIPQPTACTVRIERYGFQQSGDTVLTQYILHVDCPETSGGIQTRSSRITHTWVQLKGQWKLLGGMSFDIRPE